MTGKMDSIVTQMNIRNNVREMQESVKDLYSWEDEMKRKEEDLKKRSSSSKAATRAPRVRGKAAPVTAPGDSSLHAPSPSLTPGGQDAKRRRAKAKSGKAPLQKTAHSAAGHTYDHSKQRWDAFDVDAALAEADEDSEPETESDGERPVAQESASRPIRQKLPPAEAAEFWRGKGNDFFKFGDLARAKECYTTSIEEQPSAAAYANRALMCVKAKEWQQAEADCSLALECDPEYLKALQRRAQVRKSRGDRGGCLADLEAALRLAPSSAAIGRELRAVLAAEMDARGVKLPAELRSVPVEGLQDAVGSPSAPDVGADALAGPQGDANESVDPIGGDLEEGCADAARAAPAAAAAAERGTLPQGPQAAGPARPPAPAQTSPLRASRPASGRGSPIDGPLDLPPPPLRPPASSSEFEQHWRSCKGDLAAQAQYLAIVEPGILPRVFKSSLTPSILDGIVATLLQQTCESAGDAVVGAERCARLLEGLTAVERFAMNTMLIPGKRRAQLSSEWAAAEAAVPADVAARLQTLRKTYRM